MAINSIAIIPDGTRRWAERENVPLHDAYLRAFDNLKHQVIALSRRGISHIHIYLFSIYNLKRSREEINACLDAESYFIDDLTHSGVKVSVHGDIDAIERVHPKVVNTARNLRCTIDMTDGPLLHLYIGYSFEHHLKSFANSLDRSSSFINNLLESKIDLVVRTGGAITLSEFLPIESRYAQIYFLPELFNDLTVGKLIDLCDEYDAFCSSLKYGE
jgi:undecaprenyl diphosphate synthase